MLLFKQLQNGMILEHWIIDWNWIEFYVLRRECKYTMKSVYLLCIKSNKPKQGPKTKNITRGIKEYIWTKVPKKKEKKTSSIDSKWFLFWEANETSIKKPHKQKN